MIALHLGNGRVRVRHLPRPRRRRGFALIRLITAGICDTDLQLQRGYYGFEGIPGHEFVGEVLEADRTSLAGARVVGEINIACGACGWCNGGLGRHCPRRGVLGILRHPGAFQEHFLLPEANLHVLPDRISVEHAVFTEPVAAACEILDQVRIPRGAAVAVLGDGKLGLLAAQVLQLHGAAVSLFGHHASKLAIATRAGIETRLVSGKAPARTFEWVVEATGSAEGLRQAVSMTRPRGTVILKSTLHGSVKFDTAPVVVDEITLVGSRCGRFEPALRLIAGGKLRLDEMISDRFPLAEAPRAFKRAASRGVLKVLLDA